ncbi:hypothetical protein OROHE_018463 [Orobanche hederae]
MLFNLVGPMWWHFLLTPIMVVCRLCYGNTHLTPISLGVFKITPGRVWPMLAYTRPLFSEKTHFQKPYRLFYRLSPSLRHLSIPEFLSSLSEFLPRHLPQPDHTEAPTHPSPTEENREPIPESDNRANGGYYCDSEKDSDDEAPTYTDEAQDLSKTESAEPHRRIPI